MKMQVLENIKIFKKKFQRYKKVYATEKSGRSTKGCWVFRDKF